MKGLKQTLKQLPVRLGLIAASGVLIGFTTVQLLKPSRPEASGCSVSACVALQADHANPNVVTVPIGSTVLFSSADGQNHNLSLGDGENTSHEGEEHGHSEGGLTSGNIRSDEAWQAEFKQAGSFRLHDHYNPKIFVTVVVYQPGGDYTIK